MTHDFVLASLPTRTRQPPLSHSKTAGLAALTTTLSASGASDFIQTGLSEIDFEHPFIA